jgi:hypothetical protein
VGAGANRMIHYKDFSSANQTNHIILCVPMERDSVWLECTSQTSPYNYLGDFTSDRYALLIKNDGGELVKTHKYSAEDNLIESFSKVEMLKDGSLKCDIKSKYHALKFDDVSYYFSVSEKEKLEGLRKSLDINDYSIDDYSFRMLNEGKNTCAERDLSLTLNNCISVANERVFLPVNLITKHYYRFKKKKHRKYKIVEDECYTIRDSIIINIPDSYVVENFPKDKSIDSSYGTYNSSFSICDSQITFVRSLVVNKGEYPAQEFKKFYAFHKKIRKAERAKLVLLQTKI